MNNIWVLKIAVAVTLCVFTVGGAIASVCFFIHKKKKEQTSAMLEESLKKLRKIINEPKEKQEKVCGNETADTQDKEALI